MDILSRSTARTRAQWADALSSDSEDSYVPRTGYSLLQSPGKSLAPELLAVPSELPLMSLKGTELFPPTYKILKCDARLESATLDNGSKSP
ncbi:hypothetical protein AK812_SmicGene36597 [Symbiodinium microadriaticum]|uniref:Uncharacterized protein n=1 Tax=Symbiodinium microadriaticum TaxID=2951 RepID=A0A1Q9CIH6_SYMMI|nr:hypothetical protein AK812_SmicGene36597 [Symbiodinium microadriaticum]